MIQRTSMFTRQSTHPRILLLVFLLLPMILFNNQAASEPLSGPLASYANDKQVSQEFEPAFAGATRPQILAGRLKPGNSTQSQFLYFPLIARGCSDQEIDSQFNNSTCGWQVQSGEWTVDSDFLMTAGVPSEWSTISYDATFMNFDYRVRLMRAGCDFCANQLIIRGTPSPLRNDGLWYSIVAFQYNQDGNFSVWVGTDGDPILPLQYWTSSPAIQQGDSWNELRVIAFNNFLAFFINEELVWAGAGLIPSSGQVGVSMYRDSSSTDNKLWVDWVTLTTAGATGLDQNTTTITEVSAEQRALNEAANRLLENGRNAASRITGVTGPDSAR
jgi:hypothetical protein